MYFIKNDKVVCTASPTDGLLLLDQHPPHTAFVAEFASDILEALLWHRKLGHCGFDTLANMVRKRMFGESGLTPAVFMQAKEPRCEDCIKTKFTRHSHPTSTNGPVEPLFWLHTDVHLISDMSVSDVSVTGDIGFVSFLEDDTDFVVTTLIKRKFEVDVAITDDVAFFETQYADRGFRIKRIRSDNGDEYLSHHVSEYCARKGIVQEFSVGRHLSRMAKPKGLVEVPKIGSEP